MPTVIRWSGLFLVLAGLALTMRLAEAQQPETLIQNDLKIIVLAYQLFQDETKKPPEKAEDLAPYLGVDGKDQRLLDTLKSGKIQFQYNVPIADIVKKAGIARTILVYEQDVPTKGGYVAFANGEVRKLTPEEFKKTALAGRK